MECLKVEELLSDYIENDISEELHKAVSMHLRECKACQTLKDKIEDLMSMATELEEDVPFFLKNRLYNIPDMEEEEPENSPYLKWVAAMIGAFVLFLNLFYFTNIFPAANKTLHLVVAKVERVAVETEAYLEHKG